MDVIIHTSKIRINYPNDRQQPKAFRFQVGRSTGSYFYDAAIPSGGAFRVGGPIEVDISSFVDVSITGTYFVKVSSIHYDDTQVDGVEFTINVIEPTDSVIAPTVSVY